eukprot:309008_1
MSTFLQLSESVNDTNDPQQVYDIKALKKLHDAQLSNGENNNDQTLNIVDALGGIDLILTHYLDEDNKNTLNQQQLQQIKEIMSSPNKYKQNHPTLHSLSTINKHHDQSTKPQEYSGKYLQYEFLKNNTFLKSVWGETKAQKITEIIYSKYTMSFICFITLIGETLWFIAYNYWFGVLLIILIKSFITIPYFIIIIMSSNRTSFKLITSSFEWWFKTLNGLFMATIYAVYWYQHNNSILCAINYVINAMFVVVGVVLFGSMDAMYHFNKKWKIFCSAVAATAYLFYSIYFQFFISEQDDYIIRIPITQSAISFASMISSSGRILFIFFAKQSVLPFIRKNRSISINYHPFIKWLDDEKAINIVPAIAINDELGSNKMINDQTKELKEFIPRNTNLRTIAQDSNDLSLSSKCSSDDGK